MGTSLHIEIGKNCVLLLTNSRSRSTTSLSKSALNPAVNMTSTSVACYPDNSSNQTDFVCNDSFVGRRPSNQDFKVTQVQKPFKTS